jgi:signal transduction histidine kinase
LPVQVLNDVNHALFLFHSDENVFYRHHIRNVKAGALYLSALLTDQHIREQLRSLNPMIVSGELAAGFGHDVFNKITALELEARNLVDLGPEDTSRFKRILDLVLDLKGTVQAFQQLLKRKEKVESIEIGALIEQVVQLINPTARKEKARVLLKLPPELPPVIGNAVFLQQAFLNIALNAVQQMALKAEKFNWDGKRTLEISAGVVDACLQIRFKDNGPGIHRQHLDKLFTPGFTTRGGSGLGLYIALSFIQALGGRLLVEETYVPLKTTFMIELPLSEQEEDG